MKFVQCLFIKSESEFNFNASHNKNIHQKSAFFPALFCQTFVLHVKQVWKTFCKEAKEQII